MARWRRRILEPKLERTSCCSRLFHVNYYLRYTVLQIYSSLDYKRRGKLHFNKHKVNGHQNNHKKLYLTKCISPLTTAGGSCSLGSQYLCCTCRESLTPTLLIAGLLFAAKKLIAPLDLCQEVTGQPHPDQTLLDSNFHRL